MSTNEAKFWDRIVSALWHPKRLLHRVENGVLDGMPDSYTAMDSVANWLELKSPSEPKRGATPLFGSNHKLSQTQKNWLLTNRQAGARGWVAIETENWVILVGARHADAVNVCTVDRLIELADFSARRPLKPDDWTRFRLTLINLEFLP